MSKIKKLVYTFNGEPPAKFHLMDFGQYRVARDYTMRPWEQVALCGQNAVDQSQGAGTFEFNIQELDLEDTEDVCPLCLGKAVGLIVFQTLE